MLRLVVDIIPPILQTEKLKVREVDNSNVTQLIEWNVDSGPPLSLKLP